MKRKTSTSGIQGKKEYSSFLLFPESPIKEEPIRFFYPKAERKVDEVAFLGSLISLMLNISMFGRNLLKFQFR